MDKEKLNRLNEQIAKNKRKVFIAQKKLLALISTPFNKEKQEEYDKIMSLFEDKEFNPKIIISSETDNDMKIKSLEQIETKFNYYKNSTNKNKIHFLDYCYWHVDFTSISSPNNFNKTKNLIFNFISNDSEIFIENGKNKYYLNDYKNILLELYSKKFNSNYKNRHLVQLFEPDVYKHLLQNKMSSSALKNACALIEADCWQAGYTEIKKYNKDCLDIKKIVSSILNGYHQTSSQHFGVHDKNPSCAHKIVDYLINENYFLSPPSYLDMKNYFDDGYHYETYTYKKIYEHPCFLSKKMQKKIKNELIINPQILTDFYWSQNTTAENLEKILKSLNHTQIEKIIPNIKEILEKNKYITFNSSKEKRQILSKYYLMPKEQKNNKKINML